MKPATKEYIENSKITYNLIYVDKVVHNNPHENSHAFLIKMNEFYKDIEKGKVTVIPICDNRKIIKTKWSRFRKDYIKDYLKSHDKLICLYCYRELINTEKCSEVNKPNYITLDHVIPVSKDGDQYNPTNILIACKECNSLKDDRSELEYRLLLLKNCLCKMIFNHQLDILSKFTSQPKLLTLLRCYVKYWIKKVI